MIDYYLNMAAEEAARGVRSNAGGPFGAVICDSKGRVISCCHNTVLATHDPTNHAEVVAIRDACFKLGTHDLSGCTIYSSCEPCPMCLSAIIWANIESVYCGASRVDCENRGFRDKEIYDYKNGKNDMIKVEKMSNKKCVDVLNEYSKELY